MTHWAPPDGGPPGYAHVNHIHKLTGGPWGQANCMEKAYNADLIWYFPLLKVICRGRGYEARQYTRSVLVSTRLQAPSYDEAVTKCTPILLKYMKGNNAMSKFDETKLHVDCYNDDFFE